ncbi:WD40 repeat-like protein [Gymnopus androsaceus JB14]|uniref:WD40 repeat-like protein n=1 Tax=Gymnopus androsaceus JB14 TaxID=1447944 RepID=A0A6A4I1Y8_9AGAR|nr:WD40 repeat-like protein [Gymnopus androsaceus JB14]
MFDQAHDFNIYDGHFSNNTYYEISQDTLNKLNPVENASFKADNHSPCLKGTRTELLETLLEWAKDPHSQPIFWLSGLAGTGKSTIAQSFCEILEKHNLLGGSFFCSRESEDRREVGKIIPTLAYFLAQQLKLYYDQIILALKADATLASQGIKRQLESLFLHPLQKVNFNQHWHLILVIDALDECADMDATQKVLSILRIMPAQFYSHIHVFISCRPEYYIQQEFEKTFNKNLFKLHDIESEIVQKDILLYLQRSLHDKPISESEIIHLSTQAGKFFIYAFTQVQYLRKAPGQVALKSRLDDLLNNKVIAKSIDGLYNLLLTKAADCLEADEKEDGKYFVNLIVALSDPLSQHALSELWKPCDVDPFRSILDIPESEKAPIHIFHASFPDYILDKGRCHEAFYCDSDNIQRTMTLACIKQMNKNLKYNICNMGIKDNVSLFSKAKISLPLLYSCKYWTFHLTKCKSLSSAILVQLEKFVKGYFFFWMETICILEVIESAILGLKDAFSWFQQYKDKRSKYVQSIMYESQRFLQSIVSLIKNYPLQLYSSGLAWLPKDSALQDIRSICKDAIPKVIHGLEDTWNACEVIIRDADVIKCVEFSPDGKHVMSGSTHAICMWNVVTGQQIQQLECHDTILSIAFSPDGKMVSGSMDKAICIWAIATGQKIQTIQCHDGSVFSVAFSPDSKQLISGSENTMCVWNPVIGQQIQKLEGHADCVSCVAFSPDGKQVVSGSKDKTVCIWNVGIGKQIQKLKGHSNYVNSVAFSTNGKKVVSGSDDATICIWNAITGMQVQKLAGHSHGVISVAFSPNSQEVVSGSWDTTVRIWDISTGKQTQIHEDHSGGVKSVRFSSDGEKVVSGSTDCTVRIRNIATRQYHPKLEDQSDSTPRSQNKIAHIWNVITGKEIKKLEGHSGSVACLAFSSDGKKVASGSWDSTVCIWNAVTGKLIQQLEGHSDWLCSVEFSLDSMQVASGSRDNTICIWSVDTGKLIQKLRGHLDWVNSVAFSPDGKQVISGSDDETACIWSIATGKLIQLLTGHSRSIKFVAFSLDGKHALSFSKKDTVNGTVIIWDASNWMQIHCFEANIIEMPNPKIFFPIPEVSTLKETYTYNYDSHFLELYTQDSSSVELWISPEYQQIETLIRHEFTVSFGCDSGAVVIIQMPVTWE